MTLKSDRGAKETLLLVGLNFFVNIEGGGVAKDYQTLPSPAPPSLLSECKLRRLLICFSNPFNITCHIDLNTILGNYF